MDSSTSNRIDEQQPTTFVIIITSETVPNRDESIDDPEKRWRRLPGRERNGAGLSSSGSNGRRSRIESIHLEMVNWNSE